jgi:hypothetical protein
VPIDDHFSGPQYLAVTLVPLALNLRDALMHSFLSGITSAKRMLSLRIESALGVDNLDHAVPRKDLRKFFPDGEDKVVLRFIGQAFLHPILEPDNLDENRIALSRQCECAELVQVLIELLERSFLGLVIAQPFTEQILQVFDTP